ncbi:enoyl-CoA hydratase/isomerase family protein [Clostridium aestuarii]|uniref:Enoyl-CoA hydratase/isomerase family protein n=1 Tax=Clostridium aestuarii TaxID=338193 RepID=A0ABT4D3D2_9CLOT|nr:enoyl-CoA hydratase/isomerase family protein [Clostridium aestuarii]MCY6485751.1 enoyl-CoA hydratase/isomerase family protein [Clostridium aestuarii]
MDFKKIKYSVDDKIAYINLNSPQNLNALDAPMVKELIEVMDICADNRSVKVVIISGGERAFSSGGDIGAMRKALDGDILDFFGSTIRDVGTLALKIRDLKKPVTTSIKGAAADACFNLALLYDFRITAENTKFIQVFVNNELERRI